MLSMMTADQISKFWDIIKYAVEQSLPPTVGENPDKMNRILASLLSGKAQCWASYRKLDDNSRKFEGVMITQILYDDVSDTRSVLIYCLYGYNDTIENTWKDGFKTIVKWALSKGCTRLIGYTDNPRILQIVKMLNGEAKYTFVSIPLR